MNWFIVKKRREIDAAMRDNIDYYEGGRGGGTRRLKEEGGWFGYGKSWGFGRRKKRDKGGDGKGGKEEEEGEDDLLNKIEAKLRAQQEKKEKKSKAS